MATTCQNLLDFADPGEMPSELMNVPGFVGVLKDHTMACAPRPNEPMAFAGALAMLAHLSGAACRDERGGRTNLYLAALAPSGMGKDEPRIVNKLLASSAGIAATLPDSVASGEGLEEALAAHPSLLLQNDEADAMLAVMNGDGSRASRLSEMVLRFFSEARSCHAVRLRAGDAGKARVIPHPHLTLFATGIPQLFYSALNEKALVNGLLGRCLFIDTDGFRPLGEGRETELPTMLVDTATMLTERERAFRNGDGSALVIARETPDAKRKIAELRLNCDEITRRLMESDLSTAAALYARVYEKTMKLALLWAISENPESPTLTADAVIWGTRFVAHATHRMLYLGQFYIAEGKFDQLKKRFLRLLARHGGKLDHSTLLKRMGIDATMFRKLVTTLKISEQIEDEELSDGKHGYILRTAA